MTAGLLTQHLADAEALRPDNLAVLAGDGPRLATLVEALAEPTRTIVSATSAWMIALAG